METGQTKNDQIIFFDGVCNLCNSSVQFILKWERKPEFRFATLQSLKSKTILTQYKFDFDKADSIVLIIGTKLYMKSDAALLIAKRLRFPLNLLVVFRILPKWFRDWAYDLVARNRYNWFGKKEECMIPTKSQQNRFID